MSPKASSRRLHLGFDTHLDPLQRLEIRMNCVAQSPNRHQCKCRPCHVLSRIPLYFCSRQQSCNWPSHSRHNLDRMPRPERERERTKIRDEMWINASILNQRFQCGFLIARRTLYIFFSFCVVCRRCVTISCWVDIHCRHRRHSVIDDDDRERTLKIKK